MLQAWIILGHCNQNLHIQKSLDPDVESLKLFVQKEYFLNQETKINCIH